MKVFVVLWVLLKMWNDLVFVFIFSDLVLRNCMVGLGYVVKFGDFGMVCVMYDLDYYRFGCKGKILIYV